MKTLSTSYSDAAFIASPEERIAFLETNLRLLRQEINAYRNKTRLLEQIQQLALKLYDHPMSDGKNEGFRINEIFDLAKDYEIKVRNVP